MALTSSENHSPVDTLDMEKSRMDVEQDNSFLTVDGFNYEDCVPTPVETSDVTSHRRGSMMAGPNWPSGWRPYLVLYGCWLLMFNSWGLVNAYGTFASYYIQHLMPGRDQLLMNLIGSTQSFVVLFLSFIVGRLLDAGHAKLLVGIGTILVTLGTVLVSVVNGDGSYDSGNYNLTWLCQGFISGLGMACFFVTSSQVAATWFVKRKAVAIGIVATGASFGGLVYPVMTKYLIGSVGFNNAVRLVALVIFCTASQSFLILHIKNPTHEYRKPAKWLVLNVWVDKSAFKSGPFCWFSAAICFVFFGFYAVFFNLEDWAAYHGFGLKDDPSDTHDVNFQRARPGDAIRTFWMLSIMNVASTAGRVGAAYLAEHYGALNMHFVATSLGTILIFALWIPSKVLGPAIAFVIIYGAVSGAIIGMPPASVAHVLGRANKEQQRRLGQWTGMMYSISSVFALVGPVIAGHLVSHYKRYLTVQIWSGTCLFFGAFCMLMARLQAGPSRTVTQMRRLAAAASSAVLREKDPNKSGAVTPLPRADRSGAVTPQPRVQIPQIIEPV